MTKLYDSALPMSVPITRLDPHERLAALADPGSLTLDAHGGELLDRAEGKSELFDTVPRALAATMPRRSLPHTTTRGPASPKK